MQLREDRLLQQSPLKIISSWLLMVVQGLTFPGYSEKNVSVKFVNQPLLFAAPEQHLPLIMYLNIHLYTLRSKNLCEG